MARNNDHHLDRVNRVLDYIGEHLADELPLSKLAEVGCFSTFHFHRVFQAVTGETLSVHVRRVRLERAALLMRASPRKRITDIAAETGFPGTAEFSRAFKNHFDRTASSWDRHSPLEKSKICKEPGGHSFYSVEELGRWKAERNIKVRVNRFGAFRYVYRRIFAPYSSTGIMDAYRDLIAWLAARGTDFRDVVFIGMSLDDPSLTPAENCRYDLGVASLKEDAGDTLLAGILRSRRRRPAGNPLPGRTECERANFTIRDLKSQDVASIRCVGDLGHVDRAWHYLYRSWLPAASYEPADMPAMEIFVRIPEEIGWQTFDLQTCLPVARR